MTTTGPVAGNGASVPSAGDATHADATEHYRRAVESAPIGIVCVDGTTGRYVFVNQKFAEMIGRSHEDVLRGDPYQIISGATHPDDRIKSQQAIEMIAQGKTDTYHYEKRMLRSDGELLWASVDMYAKRDAEGRLLFLTSHFTDIHARRSADATCELLEDQLRQARKLEALGRLASGIAHDFNNRLLIIMGHTELLKNGLPTASPLLPRTDLVLGSAQRAGELTRQLLAYSRRQVLKPQAFDLNAVVDNMRQLLERLVGGDVVLTIVLNASYPIMADPGQIEQVIINLAINARDAMPHGGRLMLETKDVTLAEDVGSGLLPGDYVALVIRDSGLGISEEVLPRIFEPFFTTKEVGRGTGLGLSMVEGIVHQSGGSVQVASKPGEGSTFTICLPRSRQQPATAQEQQEEPVARDANFETVLVCDDDADVRELIANVLRLRGYTVLEANSGEHALEITAGQPGPLHLLVTDVMMPALGGIELAAQLRKREPQLRVLFISGCSEQTTLLSVPSEPGTHFLPKPFLPSDLTRVVCRILERRPPD
jgi:PAS domain S-box-containing protein